MARLSTDEAVVRCGRALIGFMPEQEAGAFLSSQALGSFEELRPTWERARVAYEALPVHDEVPPLLQDLPPDTREELDAISSTPVFQQHFGRREHSFQLVEVDRLVAFQQFVDTQFSTELIDAELGQSTLLDKVRFCLPRQFTADLSMSPTLDPGNLSLTLASLRRNVNVTGFEVAHEPDQPIKIAFTVSVGANWVQVAEFEGRFFLKNGYHRVWVLRHRGDEFVPAIVTKARSLEDVGAGPGFFPPALILSDRPPLFRHFFQDELAPELRLKSTMKVIRFTAQEFVLPRLP
jgi:hypothetical protein